jgi:outer membrane protein assembly factor BamB
MTGVNGRRRVAAAVGALLLLAGLGAVAWRVLRPGATMDRSAMGYPVRPATPVAKWFASMTSAPLIVDGRLRVYAEDRRVWADTPVNTRYEVNPYWSYRRWPAQVVGVVAIDPAGRQPTPYVVVRWSDGVVTGIQARAGRIAWQKRLAPRDRLGYTGRRTGARTVYDPLGLYTATAADGTPIMVVAGGGTAAGYDPGTGRKLWTVPQRCPGQAGWTGEATYLIRCGGRLDILDAATGRLVGRWTGASPQPAGCLLGHSGCRLITTGNGAEATLGRAGVITPAPTARPGDLLVGGGYVRSAAGGQVRVVDAATGGVRWQAPVAGRPVASDPTHVYLLTPRLRLVTLDAATGRELSSVGLPAGSRWRPGYAYVRDGFVVLERLRGSASADDDLYYYSAQTSVVLLGTRPLPLRDRRLRSL